MVEQRGADQGDLTESGKRVAVQRLDGFADELVPEQPAQSRAKQREGESGGDLVGAQDEADETMHHRHDSGGERRRTEGREVRLCAQHGHEGNQRPDEHQPFHAEIDHARSFVDHPPERGKQQGRPHLDRCNQGLSQKFHLTQAGVAADTP